MSLLASMCDAIADGLRRALLVTHMPAEADFDVGPGIVVFDEHGRPGSISPAAERWIEEIVEIPPPSTPVESKVVQAVAARARTLAPGQDPLGLSARSRVPDEVGALAAPLRHAPLGPRPWPGRCRHPAGPGQRGRPHRRPRLRAHGSRTPGDPAVHARAFDQGDGPGVERLALQPSRTTSSRSSSRPVCVPAASWWARSSSSTTFPVGKRSRTRPPAGCHCTTMVGRRGRRNTWTQPAWHSRSRRCRRVTWA